MPTPIDIFLSPTTLVIIAMYAGLMLLEAWRPGRTLPQVPGWKLKGILAFLGYVLLTTYLPLLWDRHLARFQIFDLTHLSVFGGTVVGFLVYELGAWAWHRSMHRFAWLWRIHQMHHSAERLDTYGAFYFNPLDMAGWAAIGSIALVLVVGVAPQAATNIVLIASFLTIFQHSNVETPRWLGYVIQRPESHTVHHARHVHDKNFADLPLLDLLFGSFENPPTFEHETGFYDGASNRVWDLLVLRNATTPVVRDEP